MTESKCLPETCLRATTYEQLDWYVRAFAEGHLTLLIICGSAGIGKSQRIRAMLKENVCWINGHATPFGIYLEAYEHRNQPIVLDDVDGLYRDRNGVRLLKALCQTDGMKTLSWHSDCRTLERRAIPQRFETTSRVVMISNQWQTLDANVLALEDRAHFLLFDPTPAEVHREAAAWFWDQEIFDFVAERLHLFERHSLRTYVLAAELKKAGLEWKQLVLSRCRTGATLEVAKLKARPGLATEEDRVRAFAESGAGCRATYFNHAKKLRLSGARLPRVNRAGFGSNEPRPDAGELPSQRQALIESI